MLRTYVVLTLVVLTAAIATGAPPRATVDQLRAGQTGYGLTVFAGTTPDTFGVTVLGVRRTARAGGDIIMVELSGHDLETSAVAQGMSGSPIYLDDGRLLGAVSFGWTGALRPIAGVTPVADLDRVRDRRDRAVAAVTARSGDSSVNPLALIGEPAVSGLSAALLPVAPAPQPRRSRDSISNSWPSAIGLAQELFPDLYRATAVTTPASLEPIGLGMFARPATAAGAITAAGTTLVPGSACALALVSGDAQFGAIGTVSLVEGQRLVCMAHPFMQLGPVDLPLATVEIVTMFPSREMSFKMGSAGTIVGRVTHDLRAGLAAQIGEYAPTTPVTVNVQLPTGARTFHFDVARQAELTPQLVFWTLYNALLVDGDDRSAQVVHYDLTYELASADGTPLTPVTLNGLAAGSGGAAALSLEWLTPLRMLLGNRHERLELTAVQADFVIERPARAYTIKDLRGPTHLVPGQTFTVEVELSALHGGTRHERFELQAPTSLPPGPLRLGAGSAREFFQFDSTRASGLFDDHNLAATLDLINRPRSADELVIALVATEPGFTTGGREMARLPGSVRRTLAQGPPGVAQPTLAVYALRASRRLDAVITGHAVLDVSAAATPRPHTEGDRP